MRNKIPTPALVALFFAVAGLAAQDSESRMSARDVFRAAQDMFYSANTKPTAAQKPAARPPRRSKPVAGPTTPPPPPPAPPIAVEETVAEPEVIAQNNTQPQSRPNNPSRPSATPSGRNEAQVMPAALSDQPLGLRYSLLKKTESGETVEVDSATEFRSGDSIRLEVETSDVAYLYVVNKGSSGRWNVLFPSKNIAGGANRVDPEYRYIIPPGGWFTFDEQVGEEQLFLLLSRQPVADLEQVIYDMEDPQAPDASEKPKVMLAQASTLEDTVVRDIRRTSTRDLVFEKVDDTATAAPTALPGQKAEKAVYVVTKTGGLDARVVADLTLKHK